MAREVIIRIRDDFDATALADKTVSFGYDGTSYEIDLTAANADEFDAVMARYIGAGRVVVADKPTSRRKRASSGPRLLKAAPENVQQRRRIREWAIETGYHVNAKGLIATDIIKAYAATHSDDPIRPDTWFRYRRRKGRASDAASVTAQQGNDAPVLDFMADMDDAARVRYAVAKANEQVQQRVADRKGGVNAKAQAVPDKALRDKIRQWARDKGHHVNDKGFLPKDVVAAYYKAHPKAAK